MNVLHSGSRKFLGRPDAPVKKDLTMPGNSNTSQLRVAINQPPALLGTRIAILWGRGKQYHVADFPGPLSIKSVVRGSARWRTSEADRLVDESSYLLLNSGQTYSITIDSHQPVETFCLFFRHGMAEDVCRVAESGSTWLLANPGPSS